MARILRFFARGLGLLLLLAALAVLGHDLLAWREKGIFAPLAVGQLWYDVNRASLNLVQGTLTRRMPLLWDPVMIGFLFWWAVPVMAIPGVLLYWGCRKRRG